MKIKNVIHAIELTIERHQAVLDGEYGDFGTAKRKMMPKGWRTACPLCEYFEYDCFGCPWFVIQEIQCCDGLYELNYYDDTASIKRLNRWLKWYKEHPEEIK